MNLRQELISPPNVVSMLRLLIAPLALWLAVIGREYLFLLLIAFSVFTDLLDGLLARWLNKISALGALLDSWGDFTIYSTMAASAFILWPETVVRHRYACLAIVLSFTVPILVGLIKYRSLTSYHTWSVKIAVATTMIGYFLLFSDTLAWPFTIAALVCVAAALEETLITLALPRNHADIRSLRQALQMARSTTDN